jgi:hypothetical protein
MSCNIITNFFPCGGGVVVGKYEKIIKKIGRARGSYVFPVTSQHKIKKDIICSKIYTYGCMI